ncbi:Uu.00g021580.m01.CDS01 [Anthostomella pinea]|uniref:Uu.00g021580.m01.CDS01 n=1 Tax=Anthostomella pinea TaxID=933095 RepID=A0AAI8W0C1_9PEZI|nr:Uu.00g021580.m01.CDS01 [Anthostomella pinea]
MRSTYGDFEPPTGCITVDVSKLDLRPDEDIVKELTGKPHPVTSEKNLCMSGSASNGTLHLSLDQSADTSRDTGFGDMPAYNQRNLINWYRRYGKSGWQVRLVDAIPGSPNNARNFVTDENLPAAYLENTLDGDWKPQWQSDLVRFPLLLRYGGIYVDPSTILLHSLGQVWDLVASPQTPYEFFCMRNGGDDSAQLTNFFFGCRANNALVQLAHKLYLHLWEGATNSAGMHKHPLIAFAGLIKVSTGMRFHGVKMPLDMDEVTDYLTQGIVITAILHTKDEEAGWDGPEYFREKCFTLDMLSDAMIVDQYTGFDGERGARMLALPVDASVITNEEEMELHKETATLVTDIVTRGFCLKLPTGAINKYVAGGALAHYWKLSNAAGDHVDAKPGTWAAYLRHASVYWD